MKTYDEIKKIEKEKKEKKDPVNNLQPGNVDFVSLCEYTAELLSLSHTHTHAKAHMHAHMYIHTLMWAHTHTHTHPYPHYNQFAMQSQLYYHTMWLMRWSFAGQFSFQNHFPHGIDINWHTQSPLSIMNNNSNNNKKITNSRKDICDTSPALHLQSIYMYWQACKTMKNWYTKFVFTQLNWVFTIIWGTMGGQHFL